MPPETPDRDTADQLRIMESQLNTISSQVDDLAKVLARLDEMATQAEKFLHNPIGAYKAARLGKIKVPDGPA